jgi:uncharacterized protein (DUF4213/DUF364 family)
MNLVREWLANLRSKFNDELLISDVRVGVFYTGVEVSSGEVGVAFTPRDLNDTVCCPKTAAGAPPAGRLIGAKAWETAEYAFSPSSLRRAVGISVLNALSASAIRRYGLPTGTLRENLDALDAAGITPADQVVMLGAFVPFIKKLKGQVADLRVIDKHPQALKASEQALWVPPDKAAEVLKHASVVIFSGSTLVEGGLEELLSFTGGARVRLMAGPTTPLWPHPFFERGIAILGGISVVHGRDLLSIVGQGGSGYFFEAAAQKVCVIDPEFGSRVRCKELREARLPATGLRNAQGV